MGDSLFIYDYWKKEQQVFNKNLSILKHRPDTNAVHDIRVSIKKLRAALGLYVLVSEELLLTYPLKATEEFFNTLGRQRDIEICLDLLKTFEKENTRTCNELKHYLRNILNRSFNWTTKAAKEFKRKEASAVAILLKTEILPLTNEELKKKTYSIVVSYLLDSKKYYKQPHKLRQYLKEIYHWVKIIQDTLLIHIDYEEQLHELLNDFGNWQDLQVLETRIKHFRKDFLPKAFLEYESVKMLEANVQHKKEKLLKIAFNKTNSLLRKVRNAEKEKSVPL